MCLGRVPQYIAELEAWERLEAAQSGTVSTLDEVDASAAVYNELESLGTNRGWRHLRLVVRANGIFAVRQGISEGLFGDEFPLLLVDLCLQSGAGLEAQDLMAAYVDRDYPRPSSTDCGFADLQALRPLAALDTFAKRTGYTSFLLRQYSSLLANNRLPQDWLVTADFERVWENAARDLSNKTGSDDAVEFTILSISLLCRRKRTLADGTETLRLEQDMMKATQQTCTSALTILASMSLLGDDELLSPCVRREGPEGAPLIGERLRYVLRACIAELESARPRRNSPTLGLLQLALFLSSSKSHDERSVRRLKHGMTNLSTPHTPFNAGEKHTRSHYDNVTWFVSSVARSCGRGTSVAPHQYLDVLFDRLETLCPGEDVLNNLKGATAFLLAHQTSNVGDLIYAEKLGPQLRSGLNGSKRDGETLFTGYRWDETVGEWVTASPVLDRRRDRRRILRSGVTTNGHVGRRARSLPSQLTSRETSSVPGPEMDPKVDASFQDKTRPSSDEAQIEKKRPGYFWDETLTTTRVKSVTRKSLATSSGTKTLWLRDELVDDKENQGHRRARRLPGKKIVAIRPRSSLSSTLGNGSNSIYSDDELGA
ncbi:hypothetical protein GGR56DRAFT_283171 [Xylariaceae sp. FL0804]|nr:hypothetical protein GGR56DRAFT_283171 [Xylariaceae sp. FL0804]